MSSSHLSVAVLALTGAVGAAAAPCRAVSPAYTVALVELYTSQGCSSCPPADRWLSRLPAGQPHFRAIPLALHIGYWDYIGWKDPFALKEFNDRQRLLAERNRSGRVYTPEVFVGGSELADWSHPGRFAAALAAVNAHAALANIELQAQWLTAGPDHGKGTQQLAVQARWSADVSTRDPQLLLAIKRNGYVTDVQAGENRGSTLRDDHVVRTWSGPFGSAQQPLLTELTVPAAPGDATLVAIAQDGKSGAVLQTLELPLSACEAPSRGRTSMDPKEGPGP